MALKVLVVDDDNDQLAVRGMLLRQSGFETFEATDTTSALQLAARSRPACAVIDLRLPTEEAGLELIGKLKANDPGIHVLVLTGRPSQKLTGAGRELVDDVLVKGSSARELVARLKAVSARRRSGVR